MQYAHQAVRILVREHRLLHAQIAHHHAATLVRQLAPQHVKALQAEVVEIAHRLVHQVAAHHAEAVVVLLVVAVALQDVAHHVAAVVLLHAEIIVQVPV